jgi:thiol-disulfide isomerase/thioredoxin
VSPQDEHDTASALRHGSGHMSAEQATPTGRTRRALLVAVPVLAVAGVLTWRSVGDRDDLAAETTNEAAIAEFAPASRSTPLALAGPALEEGAAQVDVAGYRGSVVVLNLWGSWCAPCRAEAPMLQQNATTYAEQGVAFIGVNVSDSPPAARAFERTYAITYPSIDDSVQQRAFLALREYVPSSAVPSTLVLDREGRVAARVIGQINDSTLRALLDAVLAETTVAP